MKQKIQEIREAIEAENLIGADTLEQFRLKYLSKKGVITDLFDAFRNVPPEEKKELGQMINDLKSLAQERFSRAKEELEQGSAAHQVTHDDLTRPVSLRPAGTRHPLSIVREQISHIFERLGYTVSVGPEIEDDWHNFSALNFPPEHPAREMQDTFFIAMNPDIALRTHTSSVQVRVMESSTPPIRTISPGRVFRNEAISARAHCLFHQVEGLYIDKGVSFADLKHDLYFFAREMFGPDTQIRLRPSYFPFTEPSAEMDVSCNICKGKGCNICKYTGWLEIMGCGMVDPNVLTNCNIDPETYSGFAFGMGIERVAMLKYQVKDIRLFFENDLRFLQQFISA
ncbi:MAG: phenylalanine--tRNA ligase subunit alpha [Bacteroidales bacterium]